MAFAEPQFELSEEDVDERTHVIAIAGEIHVSTAPRFSVLLDDAIGRGKTAVVLDLSAARRDVRHPAHPRGRAQRGALGGRLGGAP